MDEDLLRLINTIAPEHNYHSCSDDDEETKNGFVSFDEDSRDLPRLCARCMLLDIARDRTQLGLMPDLSRLEFVVYAQFRS